MHFQGHARRILTRIKSRGDSGTLPLICDSITSLAIGCICSRTKLQKGLDSYQEEDLTNLRDRWNEALSRRHKYLDSQIQSLINKTGTSSIIRDKTGIFSSPDTVCRILTLSLSDPDYNILIFLL